MKFIRFLFIAIWLAVSIFSVNLFAQDLPELGIAKATDVDNQAVESTTTFSGGFSVKDATFLNEQNVDAKESLKILGEIKVDPKDIGKTVDIVVYVSYASLDAPTNPIILSLGNNGTDVKPWNYDLTELALFQEGVELQETHQVEVFNGQMVQGKLRIHFGYLSDDALVVNQKAIEMIIEDKPTTFLEFPKDDDSSEPAAFFEMPLSIDDDRLVAEHEKRWTNGSTLKVAFDFNGADFRNARICSTGLYCSEDNVANTIIKYASEWSKHGNIYFKRASWNEADIRISFLEKGSHSYVGTDAKQIPINKSTMNLAPSFWYSYRNMQRVVLHEFGHAIGLRHEHQSPAIAYTWNQTQIIADTRNWGWSAETTRYSIIDGVLASGKDRSAFFTTKFDPKSIMIYSIPKNWVSANDLADPQRCPNATTSNYCAGSTSQLSNGDKNGIAQFYPFRNTQGGGEKINACATQYDPSNFVPGTPQWDGHIGYIGFTNSKSYYVRVSLYAPAFGYYGSIDVAPGSWFLPDPYLNGTNISIGMDWGIQVNNSPICIVKTVSDWDVQNHFITSATRLPGM
jgi:hypothetical protein